MKNFISVVIAAIFLAACSNTPDKTAEQKTAAPVTVKPVEPVLPKATNEELRNRQTAQHFYDVVINKHNVAMIDSFAAPDYLEHQYDTHYDSDRKGIKKAFTDYFTAFPDMHVKANFMMAEGDLVTAQITTTGTNTGPIYGQKGTNKKFEINGVDITRFKNGKVVEHWGYAEEGKLLTQLGLIRPLVKEGRKAQREAAKRKENKVFPVSSK